MQKTAIYFVEVEGSHLNDIWSGIFDAPLQVCDILAAMDIDIAGLEIGSEEEVELADTFQCLKDVVSNALHIGNGVTSVQVASCMIGKIHITTRDVFINRSH